MRAEVGKVNGVIKKIHRYNVIELISLLYEAANVTTCVTTERMGMLKKRKEKRTEEPFGERGIKRNIGTWRKDFNKIEEMRRQNMTFKQRDRERLKRKYRLGERRAMYLSAVLRQNIKASGIKIKRYDEKIFEEIKMSFGLDKCAVLEIRRGRKVVIRGIYLLTTSTSERLRNRVTDTSAFYSWTRL